MTRGKLRRLKERFKVNIPSFLCAPAEPPKVDVSGKRRFTEEEMNVIRRALEVLAEDRTHGYLEKLRSKIAERKRQLMN